MTSVKAVVQPKQASVHAWPNGTGAPAAVPIAQGGLVRNPRDAERLGAAAPAALGGRQGRRAGLRGRGMVDQRVTFACLRLLQLIACDPV